MSSSGKMGQTMRARLLIKGPSALCTPSRRHGEGGEVLVNPAGPLNLGYDTPHSEVREVRNGPL